jgi:hypothetical protein
VDAGHRVVLVVRPRQEGSELQALDVVLQPLQRLGEVGLRLAVTLIEELVENLGFLQPLGELVVPLDLVSETGQPGVQLLAAGGVIPDVRLG